MGPTINGTALAIWKTWGRGLRCGSIIGGSCRHNITKEWTRCSFLVYHHFKLWLSSHRYNLQHGRIPNHPHRHRYSHHHILTIPIAINVGKGKCFSMYILDVMAENIVLNKFDDTDNKQYSKNIEIQLNTGCTLIPERQGGMTHLGRRDRPSNSHPICNFLSKLSSWHHSTSSFMAPSLPYCTSLLS